MPPTIATDSIISCWSLAELLILAQMILKNQLVKRIDRSDAVSRTTGLIDGGIFSTNMARAVAKEVHSRHLNHLSLESVEDKALR